MLKELLRLFKHTCVYAVGNVGQYALQFLLLPVYTRLLTPEDYGILEILTVFGAFFGIFMQLGLRAGFTRTYLYEADQENPRDRQQVLGTVLPFLFCWSTLLLLGGFTQSAQIAKILLKNASQGYLVRLAIGGAWGTSLLQIPQAYYINTEKSKTFVAVSTLQLLLNLGLAIYWVVVVRIGVEGVLLARFVASALFGTGLCGWLLWRRSCGFSLKWVKPMLRFGIPVAVGILAALIANSSNRFFIKAYMSLADVGLYGIANKIASIMSLTMVGAFHGAYVPFQYQIAQRSDHKYLLSRLIVIVIAVFCIASLGLALFAQDLIRIMTTPAYYDAHRVVIFLVLGQTACITGSMFYTGINLAGKPEFGIPVTIMVGIANLVLNTFLIPQWGVSGAGIAIFLTYILQSALYFIVSRSLYPIGYPIGKLMLLILSTLGAYFLASALRDQMSSIILGIVANTLIVLAIGAVMVLLLTSSPERRLVWEQMKKKLRSQEVREPLAVADKRSCQNPVPHDLVQ